MMINAHARQRFYGSIRQKARRRQALPAPGGDMAGAPTRFLRAMRFIDDGEKKDTLRRYEAFHALCRRREMLALFPPSLTSR